MGYARQHLKKKGAKSERARAPEANPAKQAATAPCSHLWLDDAEAGAGAMLVACRLAGLSALEAYYAGVSMGAQCGPHVAAGQGSPEREGELRSPIRVRRRTMPWRAEPSAAQGRAASSRGRSGRSRRRGAELGAKRSATQAPFGGLGVIFASMRFGEGSTRGTQGGTHGWSSPS